MRVFDRLAEVGHHHDRAADTMASLPAGTIWGIAADAEYVRDGQLVVLDGILSHDGTKLRYVAWSGRRVMECPLAEVVVLRQRNGRLHVQTHAVLVKFESFYSLADTLTDPPSFAAEVQGDDAFAGLLSWLPNAASVL